MAVGYKSSSGTGNEFQASSRAPAVPAGAAAGDVVVVIVERWGGNPAITPAAGFTQWPTQYLSGDAASNITLFWKRLTGSDAGSYTFSWTGTLWSHAHAMCMTGVVATGTPIEAVNGWSGTAGTYGSTSVTTASIPGLIWTGYNDSVGTHTPPTGYTEVIDIDCGATGYRIGSATGTQTATGGSVTSSSPATAVLIALTPAASGSAVDIAGTSSAAGSLAGVASVARGLAGAASAAAAATGSLAAARPVAGASAAAAQAVATLGASRTISGSGNATAAATGSLSSARSLNATSAAAVVLTGDLTIAGQVALDGDITAAGDLTGALATTRPVAGPVTAAAHLAGVLDRRPGYASQADIAADLSAVLVVGRGLAAAGSASADLSGQLTVTRALSGVVSATGDTSGSLNTVPLVTRGRSFLLARTAPSAAASGNRAATGTLLDRTVPSSRGGT